MRAGHLVPVLTVCVLITPATRALAQHDTTPPQTTVSAAAAALVSFQPADDTYVGLPYLNKGLGGIGPAIGAALTLRHRAFVATVEFSVASIEVEQSGRLADDRSTGRLRDSLLSLLAGTDVPAGAFRARILGGISRAGASPSSDGVPIDEPPGGAPLGERTSRWAPTVGIDLTRALKGRVGLLGTLRFAHIDRSEAARQRGVGSYVLRGGIGLTVRLVRP